MATVATLETRMALNSTAFRQGMIQAANQANASLGSISKQAGATASVLLSLKRAANTFGSFYLVKDGLSSLIEAQKQLQAIHFTLMAATGSSTLAADAFKFVSGESQKLGLVLPTAAQGFANLSASATAAGVSLSDQKELFDAYARSSTALHLSTEQSSRALLALEQMFAKGKIQAQELRLQLGQAIPGAAQRFQNAVMEMTKGTSLAGKSFDQLLAAGDLTTSKFLPALVKALQDSGRGVEQAAQGLQANLNRVQTAWFNLKTDVSGGLFNDAATAGAGLLADNLGRIAGLVTLIGAGGLAKISGGALDSGASKVVRLQQEYKGAQMAAAAEVKYASAIEATAAANLQRAEAAALENQVVKDAAASALADAKAREIEAFGIKEAALAEMQRVEAAAALNESMAAGTVAKRTSAELDVRLAATSKALTAAEAQLTASLVTQAAARDTLALAEGRQAALRGGVLEASAAATAAAATAAKVRAAEVALGGFAAAAGRAAKSFGAFAMGLVGGPWGLAVAAIGGIGYAIYSAQKQGEEWRKETAAQVESLKQLTETAKAAADEYGRLGSNMTLSQGISTLDSSQKELNDKREAIQKLREEAQRLQAVLAANPDNTQNAIANGFTAQKIEQLTTRIKELEAELPPAQQATGALSDELRARLTPAVDGLKKAIATVKNGGGLGDFIWNLASPQDIASGIKDIEHAQQLANSALGAMSTLGDKARKDLLTKGKSRVDQLNAELAVATSNIRAQRLSAEKEAGALAAAQAEYAKQLPDARKADIADNAKKTASAINQEAEAYKSLVSQINSRIEQDKEAAADTSKLTEAQRLQIKVQEEFKVGKTKLTAAHQEEIKQQLAAAVAQSLVTRATEQQRDADKSLLDLDRQLAEQAEQRARTNARLLEGMGHGDQWNAERAGIESIQDAYRQQRVEADKAYEAAKLQHGDSIILSNQHAAALGKITAGEQEAIVAQQQFYDDQRRNNADWGLGFSKAIENFQTQQQNNAAAAGKMVDDLTSGFTNAFTAFVSGTESAKSAFGSWIDDMYKQALAFVANKAIQALFDSFGSMGGGSKTSTPGSTAGGWASLAGNFMNAFGFSGGKASGGDVHPWGSYSVAENGPEILKVGNRNILMMGDQSGTVVPNNRIGRAAGNTTVTNIYVQPTSTRRTADQIATANARAQRLATTRNG